MKTDLLSEPVQPGQDIRTGVVLPSGNRVAGDPTYTGAALGAFTTLEVTHTDNGVEGVWYELHAQLSPSATEETRLSADINYGPVS